MNRSIRWSFLIILIAGAIVLVTRTPHAYAISVSTAWTGNWSCNSSTLYTNYASITTETLRRMTIAPSGEVSIHDIQYLQYENYRVGSQESYSTATCYEMVWPWLSFRGNNVQGAMNISTEVRCIGKLAHPATLRFQSATCIVDREAYDDWGNFHNITERFECSRDIDDRQ